MAAQVHQEPALADSEATNASEQSITANTKSFLSMFVSFVKWTGKTLRLRASCPQGEQGNDTPGGVGCQRAGVAHRRSCGAFLYRHAERVADTARQYRCPVFLLRKERILDKNPAGTAPASGAARHNPLRGVHCRAGFLIFGRGLFLGKTPGIKRPRFLFVIHHLINPFKKI